MALRSVGVGRSITADQKKIPHLAGTGWSSMAFGAGDRTRTCDAWMEARSLTSLATLANWSPSLRCVTFRPRQFTGSKVQCLRMGLMQMAGADLRLDWPCCHLHSSRCRIASYPAGYSLLPISLGIHLHRKKSEPRPVLWQTLGLSVGRYRLVPVGRCSFARPRSFR